MPKQDHLLPLIASLSPSEKRYFKLFGSTQPGPKEYLSLFELLEDKLEYNPAALSKELDITTGTLAERKRYLSQVLLRSLASTEETSAEMVVYRGYIEAHALMERRLFDYALDLAERNIEKAKELELFMFLPNLIFIKLYCLHGLQRHLEIPALTTELNACQLAAAELFEIVQLRYSMVGFERLRDFAQMKELFKHPLLKKKVTALKSLRAQMAWFDFMTRYILFFDTPDAFRKIMMQEVKHYEKAPQAKVLDALTYLHSFAKMARAEVHSGEYENALPWLEKLIALLDNPPLAISLEKADALRNHSLYYTSFALRRLGRFSEALPFAKRSFEELGEGYPYEHFSFRLEYALVLFHAGYVKEATDEIDALLQLNTDMCQDLQLLLRPLMILIQLDMGNKSVVPYLIKSAKAWLKRNNKSSNEADVFFRFTYAIAKANGAQLPQIFLDFKTATKEKLTGYLNDGNINLGHWIERQIAKSKRPA